MQNEAQSLGILGEELAYQYLSRQGYKILIRNYECFLGEIDMIAKHKGVLVFVEVKTRSSELMGHPAEAINPQKQKQLSRVANFYLKCFGLLDYPCRFDAVSILMEPQKEPRIELIQNAF